MKHKNRKIGFIMVIALMMIVTACGANSSKSAATNGPTATADSKATEAPSAAPTEAPKGPVTLTVQYPKSDDPTAIDIENSKMKRFGEKYPNVTMKKNDWQYAPNEIGIKMAAHQAPSNFNTFATEGKTLVSHKWTADLTPFLKNYAHANDFDDKLIGPLKIDGKLYAVPKSGYIMMVTINKKLFAAKNVPLPTPDWTWDDFYAAAKATADPAKGIAGFAMMAKGNTGGWNWTNFLLQAGGVPETVADGKVTSAFNSEAGVKAMEFVKKLRWEGNALPQNWALDIGDVLNLFKQGRAAIELGNWVEDAVNNGGMKKEDLMLLPMPSMTAGGDHVGVLGGDYQVVNPQEAPEVQQAAFDYITFDLFNDSELTDTKRVLEERKAKSQVLVPPIVTYYKSDSEQGKKMKALYDQYPDSVFKIDPKTIELAKGAPEASYNGQDYYAAMTNVMQEVFTNKNTDVKALLDAAAKKFDTEVLSKVTVQ